MGHLVIRADGSSKVGAGHIMRCLALAQAWRNCGGTAIFLCHCTSDALRARITEEGFDLESVEAPHPDPCDLKKALRRISALQEESGNRVWVVLDGYHLGPGYQKALQEAGYRLLVIDDTANHSFYHADIVLNQNLWAERMFYPCDLDTKCLLGTRYTLLRQEFLSWRNWNREIPEVARNILVTLGGADPDNVTLRMIEALGSAGTTNLDIKVLLGPANPHRESVKSALASLSCRFHLIYHVENMTELMAWADLALTSGGSTCLEMAFMGLPSVIVTLAENQEKAARALQEAGVALSIGWFHVIDSKRLAQVLDDLVHDRKRRQQMSRRGRHIVDGMGAKLVTEAMQEQLRSN